MDEDWDNHVSMSQLSDGTQELLKLISVEVFVWFDVDPRQRVWFDVPDTEWRLLLQVRDKLRRKIQEKIRNAPPIELPFLFK